MTAPTIRDVRSRGIEFEAEAVPTSVAPLRRCVVATLREWRVLDGVVDTVELLTSELVTNAVQHARHSFPERSDEPGGAGKHDVVRTRVRICGRSIVLEVWDADPRPPTPREQGAEDERGRGLLLVSELAEHCGYYWSSVGGKVVWIQVPMIRVPARSTRTGSANLEHSAAIIG